MSGLNSFCGCGRLVSNAIALNTQNGGAKFRLAIDGFKKDDTLFLDCVRFGNLGNTLGYLTKGACVAVVGRLSESKYKNAQGVEVKSMSVIVSTLQLIGNRSYDTASNVSVPSENASNNNYANSDSSFGYDSEPFDDTGIPF